jgi:hypothetical protein
MMNKASDKLRKMALQSDKVFQKAVRGGFVDFLLKEIPDLIRVRTRLGKGVSNFGKPLSKLKALSDSYSLQRQGAKKGSAKFRAKTKDGVKIVEFPAKTVKKLADLTTPKKSNLTYTGQLLDSIQAKRLGTVIEVSLKQQRNDGLTNDKVAGYVKGERPFLNLAKTEITNVQRKVKEKLTGKIAEILNRVS